MQLSLFEKEKSTDWKWSMSKDYPQKNGLKVFSCFACGGGSTMGYKLAGCEVVGCNEIDKRMNDVYVANHNPKYNYLEDIRDFNKRIDLSQELFELDILDGSPPCSTFSMAGQREEAWGKEKKFREGQKMQTLDDLLFVFIDTVAKLKPKVAIMENVEGLMLGNAWSYVQEIYKRFNAIGYQVKHWLLKGETMGVPQTRHRVFFVATKLDFDLSRVNMGFDYEPVLFKHVKSPNGYPLNPKSKTLRTLLDNIKFGDTDLSLPCMRIFGKRSFFNNNIVYDDKVCNTISAKNVLFRYDTREYLSSSDIINIQTFPQDYKFIQNTHSNVNYICGMSVPPIMIKRLMIRLIESGLFNYKLKGV